MSSDTGFFDPGMPGEVVRLRFPAYGVVYLMSWAVVGVLLVVGVYVLFSGNPVPALVRDLAGPAGAVGLIASALIVFYTRWRILVTNRRVMMRPGFLTWKFDEIRLDEIEAVGFGNDRMSIRGRNGKEISAKILALTAMSVAGEIGVRHGLRKVTDGSLEDFLEKGEVIRYQEPTGWEARLLRFRWPIIFGILVAMALFSRLVDLPEWLHFLSAVPFIILVPAIMLKGRAPWRLAATDRRLMVRWNLMAGGPYLEEIRFDRITRIRYDRANRELILDEPQHRVAIVCGRRRAKRILAATGRAAEGLA